MKCDHTRYNKNKKDIDRILENYLTYSMYKAYMEKMIVGVVGRGNFYSLRKAEAIINKSDLKNKTKIELREFLVCTYMKRDLNKSRDFYGRYKYEKYICILNKLEINQ